MKKIILIALCALTMTMTSSFTPAAPEETPVKVSWQIGDNGELVFLYINKNFVVGGCTGKGHTFVDVVGSLGYSYLVVADDDYVVDDADFEYDPINHECLVWATFIPDL